VNVVTLIGNLASDVDLRTVGDAKQVASFLLAVDRPAGAGADFVRVSAWDRQAESCAEHLTKGQRVAIDGRLRSSSWETSEGERRTAVEVVAHRVEFLSPPAAPGEVVPLGRAASGA
ncbi:MAG: single-stranded DNA-binding protein, partial [Pseudomonadota bacterium]